MRPPKPWFRASKNAWHVELHAKKIRLGSHPDGSPPPKKTASGWNPPPAILDAFYKLMSSDPANLPKADKLAVRLLCDLFLENSQAHHSPDTYTNYRHFLQSFCDSYGSLLAADVKPFHVSRWLDDIGHVQVIHLDPGRHRAKLGQVGQRPVADKDQAAPEDKLFAPVRCR